MLIHLHSQATTTPKVRAEIQASDEPAWVLAERHAITEQTVWKWRKLKPSLFKKQPYYRPGCDTCFGIQVTIVRAKYKPVRGLNRPSGRCRSCVGFLPQPFRRDLWLTGWRGTLLPLPPPIRTAEMTKPPDYRVATRQVSTSAAALRRFSQQWPRPSSARPAPRASSRG